MAPDGLAVKATALILFNMAFSSIQKKKCKCGCNRYPSLGYNGYSYNCAPQEIKDKVGSKQNVAQKNRNARNLASRKAHSQINQQEGSDSQMKELWFAAIRQKLTGTCQCGCGNPSSKDDYIGVDGKKESHFRSSCCHIFPKSDFHSIKYHPLNYVERAFWGGCHTNMDNKSMDRWVGMSDWDDIKAKFYILAPLLTKEEQATKFYSHLEKLVFNN